MLDKMYIQKFIFWGGVAGLLLSLEVCFVLRWGGPSDLAALTPTIGIMWFFYCIIEILKLKYKEL